MTDLPKQDEPATTSSRDEVAIAALVGDAKAAEAGALVLPSPAIAAISRGGGRSPSQILWLKLRSNRAAMLGLYTLAVMYAAAILAGFIAPYKYDNARHDLPFSPPMLSRIHFFDEQGSLRRPFVYGIIP